MDFNHGRNQGAKNTTAAKAQHRPLLDSHRPEFTSSHNLWWRWKAFMTMIVFLLGGLAFALGHHFMNHYLNGREVTSISVSQSWIFRFGTAFAFLVNMAFAVSASASYVQYQWFKFHRQSFRVDEIDSLTDVLQNGLRLFYNTVFLHQPLLLLMAIAAWTIPFAAVVAPGSLTVEPARITSIVRSYVPQPAYNSTYFGNVTYDDSNGVETAALVYKLAYNTAAAGQPVALSSRLQNESYSLAFDGPAVKCASAPESLIRNQSLEFDANLKGGGAYQYISWVPGYQPSSSETEALDFSSSFMNTLDETDGHVARIFVTTGTGTWNNTIPHTVSSRVGNFTSNYTSDALVLNVTECQLWNATYDVDFTFQYPNQTRQVTISKWLNPVAPPTVDLDYIPPSHATASSRLSYLCVMQAFGKLLVGCSDTTQYTLTTVPEYTVWQIIDINWSESLAVQRGLESLFQNLTLSLLSSHQFTKSKSDSELVPVTVTRFPTTYIYTSYELLIPYSLAFALVLLCVIIGSYASFVDHASYQNIFSSFLRATSGHEIHAVLDSNDEGADPLPKDYANAKVIMGSGNGKSN